MLRRLLSALHDPTARRPHLGHARFDSATFTDGARFDGAFFAHGAHFTGAVFARGGNFGKATFTGTAWFGGATFTRDAHFGGVLFASGAKFSGATFTRRAQFNTATFARDAWFGGSNFTRDAQFNRVTFSRDAYFGGAIFMGGVQFNGARFEAATRLGPLVCKEALVLDGAVFEVPVTVEAAARVVTCGRTRWASAATLRLRYSELNLRDAVLEYPLAVTARAEAFLSPSGSWLPETLLSDRDPGVRLTVVDGVDAAHLVLHDVDLSICRFAGAIHLDQLRVDGWCTFATTPTGIRSRQLLPRWWSQRSTLVEEHHWRAQRGRSVLRRGWTAAPEDTPVLKPASLAALYRQLRKSLEDGKNEPDAADFYYGEMEMRRHDVTRPQSERALLAGYWALSGYGLRATRALAWLLGAMAITLLALLLWGLPAQEPTQSTTGRQVAVGQRISLTTDTPAPANPVGTWAERITAERSEKALRVVVNSVIFRSADQHLTVVGTYIEMASRLAEPILLGLALLAIRSRVKR
ncbi:pentapeptide repeat-containing protein [Streptomyces sp. NPDC015684]|uniref:pentapeptide repeat-containing protein n=1 Tax=Streptomyces sp. NPDC015684 TaxID=3364963 RepID=UPI003701A26D